MIGWEDDGELGLATTAEKEGNVTESYICIYNSVYLFVYRCTTVTFIPLDGCKNITRFPFDITRFPFGMCAS